MGCIAMGAPLNLEVFAANQPCQSLTLKPSGRGLSFNVKSSGHLHSDARRFAQVDRVCLPASPLGNS
jgi:hypothetical protein